MELTTAEMRTLVWLAGWEESTVATLVSAIRKAMAAEEKRREQPLRP
ncbi:DNA ligase [Blautia obeum]|uniref:DNA ligase n=1 Tax=Blautia obeum TaxID=40520 RepID=A0A414I9D6_9FIRM|nr:DNA ligase [Blautia obeum]RHQ35226.1 DNA ligase [Ruminococcus sp. AF25-28AC]RKQ28784.1 DNA ligase [Ruminococcus sp. B05]TAP33681.1 DNA ligase [Mediterraneibacter sp. gm002]